MYKTEETDCSTLAKRRLQLRKMFDLCWILREKAALGETWRSEKRNAVEEIKTEDHGLGPATVLGTH